MHERSPAILISLLLVSVLTTAPDRACARSTIQHLCLEDLLDGNGLERIAIPPGCQLIDCCADCPASSPLTWRVRVLGEAVASVGIEFEDLPAGQRFQVEGDGRPTARGARRDLDSRPALAAGRKRGLGLADAPGGAPWQQATARQSVNPWFECVDGELQAALERRARTP
jgi:hypothetical protein